MGVAILVIVLSGCRLDVVADLVVEADGSGTVAVGLRADEATTEQLRSLDVDPTRPLAAATRRAPDWEVEQGLRDGALTVELRHAADRPEALAEALRELSSGLIDDDPALLIDLDVDVSPDGAVRLEGEAGFRPPATAGALVDGEPLGPAVDELAALTAQAVHPRLRVTLPDTIVTHDADEADRGTLVWELPVGESRSVAAASQPSEGLRPVPVATTVGVVVLVLALGGLWRRRRRTCS